MENKIETELDDLRIELRIEKQVSSDLALRIEQLEQMLEIYKTKYVTRTAYEAIQQMLEEHKDKLAALEADTKRITEALEESVKLQSHYAELLNMHDGGKRITFSVESWLARLRETAINATLYKN